MTDSDIKKILTDTGVYQAQYKPVPLAQLPSGCLLPAEVDAAINLSDIDLPDITKVCAPPFFEVPLQVDPFAPPENCPNGISFNTTLVNVYSDITDTQPRAQLPISVVKQNDDICTFDIVTPDVVIPCFPGGPAIGGTATLRVIDPNTNTTTETNFSIVKDASCTWTLQGDPTIVLPTVPCINGIAFAPGIMPVTSTCSSLANYVDNKQVVINRHPGSECLYTIDLPTLKIPCYPNGPTVRGGFNVTVTDSVNNYSGPEQSAEFITGVKTCCDFNLAGDIVVDVPCQQTGVGLTFSGIDTKDPFTDETTHYDGTVTKPDFCNIDISLPPINVPCSDGIKFDGPIKFAFQDYINPGSRHILGGGSAPYEDKHDIDLSDTGVRDPNKSCTWDTGMVINIPTPLCPGGFYLDSSSLKIKLNSTFRLPNTIPSNPNNYVRYNALTFKKTTPSIGGQDACGFEIGGEINLGLPPFALQCSALTVGGQNNIDVKIGNDKIGDIGLAATGCGFQFTTNELTLPTLNCPVGFQADSSDLHVVDSQGQPSSTSSLSLTANGSCGVKLSGTLVIPSGSASGSGVSINNWNPDGTYSDGQSIMVVAPEGDASWYRADGNASGSQVPGTPGAPWTELFSADKVFPYLVIRCTEHETPSQLGVSGDDETKGEFAIVKVVPTSYLFQSAGETSRYNVLGLNTPFVLKPGETVFLEVVFDNTGAYGEATVAYAAVCKGPAIDYDVGAAVNGGSPNPNYVPATSKLYKTLTSAQVNSMATLTGGIANYTNKTTTQIIGLNDGMQKDLAAYQANCINNIKLKNDNIPYQIKAYAIIAKAEAGDDLTAAPADGSQKLAKPAPGGLALSYTDGGTTVQYTVKQVVRDHLEIQVHNQGTGTANMPIRLVMKSAHSETPNYMSADPATRQPDITITNPGIVGSPNLRDLHFDLNGVVTSTLLDPVVNVINTLNASGVPSGEFQKDLAIGAKCNNIQVYYTIDGSIPTINTFKNKSCVRYDPDDTNTYRIDTTVTKRVSWIAVNPEFAIADPRTISTV